MFDFKKFTKFDSVVSECKKLLTRHDELSYKSAKLSDREFSFVSKVKLADPLSKDVSMFYENYTSRLAIMEEIKSIIADTDYNIDDLHININRSEDTISEILSALTIVHHKLLSHHESLIHELSSVASEFCLYIKDTVANNSNIANIIDVIYSCMAKDFIRIGMMLIQAVHTSGHMSDAHKLQIRSMNDALKSTILDADANPPASTNLVQTFGIVPDEGSNRSFSECMDLLFGIKIKSFDINATAKSLQRHTGLFVFVSKNADTYFDMSSLKIKSSRPDTAGVDSQMVKTFDIIKQGDAPSAKQSELLEINISDNTEKAYAIWTNNMQTFKLRSEPIGKQLIEKLRRQSPSPIIGAYNKLLTDMIMKSERNGDAISFNRVKNMSFNESINEAEFIKQLQAKLEVVIYKQLKGQSGDKLHAVIASDDFENVLLDEIDRAKEDFGVHPSMLSTHCHIIYASMTESIVSKIKKELYIHSTITKELLKAQLPLIIATNDNIYSRVIAAHYLHIA